MASTFRTYNFKDDVFIFFTGLTGVDNATLKSNFPTESEDAISVAYKDEKRSTQHGLLQGAKAQFNNDRIVILTLNVDADSPLCSELKACVELNRVIEAFSIKNKAQTTQFLLISNLTVGTIGEEKFGNTKDNMRIRTITLEGYCEVMS